MPAPFSCFQRSLAEACPGGHCRSTITRQAAAARRTGCRHGTRCERSRGARHRARGSSRRNLVCGGFLGTRTMMQSCASGRSSGGGGPILAPGMRAMVFLGTPPPRIVIGGSSDDDAELERSFAILPGSRSHEAGRSTMPSGVTPVVTRRHSAMSSLRASATIIVLRVPRVFSVRCRYHLAKALSCWNIRNRQAN